jgi:hypothetical protein
MGMRFLDKLLGRDKGSAPSTPDTTEKTETLEEERPHGSVEDDRSEIGQAEQRLDNARDQALRDEGRMP